MFGTLIIQLPSKFTGGALVIEHASEKKTFDFSSKSHEGFYATAFYADCEHELLPIKTGWRLCLAYNLLMCRKDNISLQELPSASTILAQSLRLRKLANCWPNLFNHTCGYLLEHDYTETNLHFNNLKGRDKEVVNLLRGSYDVNGNPLFVACLMLISKHESGSAEYSGGYGRYSRYDDDDDGPHTMEEVYDTEVDTQHWIGPDDNLIKSFKLQFDLEESLLTDEDIDELFDDKDPSREEYESYTGNAGPTLDYWYYRGAVAFWPRSMNIKVMKKAGTPYMLSYLKAATSREKMDICNLIVKHLEEKKLHISSDILSGVCSNNDDKLIARALKTCNRIPDKVFAQELAKKCISKSSEVETEILELVERTSNVEQASQYSHPLELVFVFLQTINANAPSPFSKSIKESIIKGAFMNNASILMNSKYVDLLAKISYEIGGDSFQTFCNAVKSNPMKLSSILKCLISLGNDTTKNPLVIELANIRAKQWHEETKSGSPAFSWRQPEANFPGSHSDAVHFFLMGDSKAEVFYNFNGIGHARNWASKYFGEYGQGTGYSATATANGTGKKAYVIVTKTMIAHQKATDAFKLKKEELGMLKEHFMNALEVNIDASVEASSATDSCKQNQRTSSVGPSPKRFRVAEVTVID